MKKPLIQTTSSSPKTLAFLVSVITASFTYAILLVSRRIDSWAFGEIKSFALTVVVVFVFGCIFAALFAIVPYLIGLYVAERLKIRRPWYFILGGAFTGFCYTPLSLFIPPPTFMDEGTIEDIVNFRIHTFAPLLTLAGAAAGLVCWFYLRSILPLKKSSEERHKEAWKKIRSYEARSLETYPLWEPKTLRARTETLPERLTLSLKNTGNYDGIHDLRNRYRLLSLAVMGKITHEEFIEFERKWAAIVNARGDILKGLSREEIINLVKVGINQGKGTEKVVELRKAYRQFEDRSPQEPPAWAEVFVDEYNLIELLVFAQGVADFEKMSQTEREEQFCGRLSQRLYALARTGRITQEECKALTPMLIRNRWL